MAATQQAVSSCAAPTHGQQMVLTILADNSLLNWATREGGGTIPHSDLDPSLFWKTPHITDEDMKDNLASVLSRMIPDDPHDYIFGDTAGAEGTGEMAQDQSLKRPVEKISIYVVSTNSDQLTKLQKVFAAIPSNFVILESDDFFTKREGRYDGMGTDRLATVTGAVQQHGHPALVFDGGTATTYTATNSTGHILGGGIGPGIQCKLQSLSNDTDALPAINAAEVISKVEETVASGKPMATFANNTKDAMLIDVFQEFAGKGRNVIQQWMTSAYPPNNDKKNGSLKSDGEKKYNSKRIVTVTGGDGDILEKLLHPKHGGLIESPEGGLVANNDADAAASVPQYEVHLNKHLIHYGIAAVLGVKVQERQIMAKFSTDSHINKRVAKVFDTETDDGDNVFRGTVVEEIMLRGVGKTYSIRYDDGDSEDVTARDLFDMIGLFQKCGEKPFPKAKRPKKDEKKAPDFPMKKPPPKKQPNGGTAPAAKKAKKAIDIIKETVQSEPASFVNKRVAKDFDGECFFGTITLYDDKEAPPFWHVVYDDGDEEDYASRDLIKALKHYKKHGNDDKKKIA